MELSLWLKIFVSMTWDFSVINFWSSEFWTSLKSLMMLMIACRACLLADLLPRVWKIYEKNASNSSLFSLTKFFFRRESLFKRKNFWMMAMILEPKALLEASALVKAYCSKFVVWETELLFGLIFS